MILRNHIRLRRSALRRLPQGDNNGENKEDRCDSGSHALQRFIEAFGFVEEHLSSTTDGSQTFTLAFLEQDHPN